MSSTLMPEANHRATFGVYARWRAALRQEMGGTFDWANVTESQMRGLSEQMFDAANVPANIRGAVLGRIRKNEGGGAIINLFSEVLYE